MDKIIKAKLVLPAYLTLDAKELIRSVSDNNIALVLTLSELKSISTSEFRNYNRFYSEITRFYSFVYSVIKYKHCICISF